jgi:hypothetical protein
VTRAAALLTLALLLPPLLAKEAAPLSEVWTEPTDLESRDLFHGRGGKALVPPDVPYRFISEDTKGHSDGYEVEDPQGRVWDVKVGHEGPSETVLSRVLWAIGYHQPVIYYVKRWRMEGGPTATPPPGRFRLESDHEKKGVWEWRKNPHAETRQLRGLAIVNLLFNNWDLDESQNRIYEPKEPGPGPRRWYVVQDIGASLGRTRFFTGTGSRNDLAGFESQGFIKDVENGRVDLDSHYFRHRYLRNNLDPEDVLWTCRLLARLSDAQWDDAFRAAGYPEDVRRRYIAKIQEKIQEGLELAEKKEKEP